ncbi:MAG: hypothetical protein HKN62_01275 [Phycisphaerales bacterium]|nr:hypothetical protein [Phycisphaerales bacterium]
MDGWLAFAGQLLFAAAGLWILRGRVFPALPTLRAPGGFADVWIPLVTAGPLVFFIVRVHGSVDGVGWAALGGPSYLAWGGLGVALLAGGAITRPGTVTLTAVAAAGLFLLLLGAAHDLTIWTGQVAFAVVAVVLWMNTPAPVSDDHTAGPVAAGVLLAVGAAVAQGACAMQTEGRWIPASVGVALAYGFAVLALAARRAGPAWALRIAGWSAAAGTLLAIGMISVLRLVPEAWAMALGRGNGVVPAAVAHGFGRYALEAILLLAWPAAVIFAARLPPPLRRPVAGGLILATIAAALVRAS